MDNLGKNIVSSQVVVVQLPSRVRLFATPWTAARQASLSLTNSWSLPKFISIASVMPSSHLILWHPLLLLPSVLPSIRNFSSESVVHIRWPEYWSSASASVLPMNIQGWFPLGFTGLIFLQSKTLSRVFLTTLVIVSLSCTSPCAMTSLWYMKQKYKFYLWSMYNADILYLNHNYFNL